MAPINDAVFLRRNNQIQDAIDGQNLKQALQLIEKRVKKGEDTRFLKVSGSNPRSIEHLDSFCPLCIPRNLSFADCRLHRPGKRISSGAMRTKPTISAVLPRHSSCAKQSRPLPTLIPWISCSRHCRSWMGKMRQEAIYGKGQRRRNPRTWRFKVVGLPMLSRVTIGSLHRRSVYLRIRAIVNLHRRFHRDLLTSDCFRVLGCHEPSKKLPQRSQVLFLGYFPQPHDCDRR